MDIETQFPLTRRSLIGLIFAAVITPLNALAAEGIRPGGWQLFWADAHPESLRDDLEGGSWHFTFHGPAQGATLRGVFRLSGINQDRKGSMKDFGGIAGTVQDGRVTFIATKAKGTLAEFAGTIVSDSEILIDKITFSGKALPLDKPLSLKRS